MKFRAVTHNYELIYFTVADGPVAINDKSTILVNRPGSPMILSKSIMRGTDDGVFESDFVLRKEDITLVGFVVYIDGFYVWDYKRNNFIPLRDTSKFLFTENTRLYRIDSINKMRRSIRFFGGDRTFRLERIMYSKNGMLYVDVNGDGVNISDVKLCTGIEYNHTELYYGQSVNNGTVEFHDYHPMLKMFNGEYRELEEDDYVNVRTSQHNDC